MHKEIPFARLALAVCLGLAPMTAPAVEQSTDLLTVVQSTLDTNPELRSRLDAFYASTVDDTRGFDTKTTPRAARHCSTLSDGHRIF